MYQQENRALDFPPLKDKIRVEDTHRSITFDPAGPPTSLSVLSQFIHYPCTAASPLHYFHTHNMPQQILPSLPALLPSTCGFFALKRTEDQATHTKYS